MLLIEEIKQGKSETLDFMVVLPKESEIYIKTVIAFANTKGGKIIIGVDEQTREIIGINEDLIHKIDDQIITAIADSVYPQIIPSVELFNIDGKYLIVIAIEFGKSRPYYFKTKGKEFGTYIRAGSTNRLALSYQILELELEGTRKYWDRQIYLSYNVTERAITKLCRDLNSYRRKNNAKLPKITKVDLENWGLLLNSENGYLATNAFVLFSSSNFKFSKTQCAVFAGNDRTIIIDRKEFSGPLYEQVGEAFNYVLKNIHRSLKIVGLQGIDSYELPLDAIREIIVNAHCHRNYLDNSCVQVFIFENRLEVTSPGGLYGNLTLESALQGRTIQRNESIANVFKAIGFVENWGLGLKKIQDLSKKFGLPNPEFIVHSDCFRVNLYRKTFGINVDSNNDTSIFKDDSQSNVGSVIDNKNTDARSVVDNKNTDAGSVIDNKNTDAGSVIDNKTPMQDR